MLEYTTYSVCIVTNLNIVTTMSPFWVGPCVGNLMLPPLFLRLLLYGITEGLSC